MPLLSLLNGIAYYFDLFWQVQKPKVANRGSGVPEDRQYDGRIEDVAKDGSVDYKGRPANKRAVGRWKAVLYIMGVYWQHCL